jgi:hypothetical protein
MWSQSTSFPGKKLPDLEGYACGRRTAAVFSSFRKEPGVGEKEACRDRKAEKRDRSLTSWKSLFPPHFLWCDCVNC